MTTTDVYGAYRAVLAAEFKRTPSEWTFKSDPDYRQILEHVSPEQGEAYIAVILRDFPTLWKMHRRVLLDIALANDSVGKPVTAPFDSLGITCSPTNFRYMWQALSIVQHMQREYLGAQHIVEIGGGYGGLALYLCWAFPSWIKGYTIVDLPEAGAIQTAFARELNFSIFAPERAGAGGYYLVSAYGFSELDPEIRAEYEQKIIPKCQHGFMVWNLIEPYPFTDKPLTIVDEDPLTGHGNKVITW